MANFNLKNYKKIDGNIHIDQRLEEQRKDTPNVINEKQLEDSRVGEQNRLTEKQLKDNQTGESTQLTERALDLKKAKFDIKHRNPDAFNGSMNKLEEKRLQNDPVEKEKYKSSETSKKMRWWEKDDSKDGLKLAKSTGAIPNVVAKILKEIDKVAAHTDTEDIDEYIQNKEQEEIVPPEWQALNPNEDKDENSINDLEDDTNPVNDFTISDLTKEDIDPNELENDDNELNQADLSDMSIVRSEFISGKIPAIYLAVDYNSDAISDVNMAKQEAYDTIIQKYPLLEGVISSDDFFDPTPSNESKGVMRLSLRDIGKKYTGLSEQYGEHGENTDITHVGEPINAELDQNTLETPETTETSEVNADINDSEFTENSYSENDVNGTPMANGELTINSEINEENRAKVLNKALNYLNHKHPEINLDVDAIDDSNILNGKITYLTPITNNESNYSIIDEANSNEFLIVEAVSKVNSKKKLLTKR